mgnify:CR=1 FL=1|jgi:predicted aminopeptidase
MLTEAGETEMTVPACLWRRASLRSALLLVLLLPLGGCYYLQAAAGQAEVLSSREPIDAVIADEATSPALKARLTLVREARNFAVAALGLPDNETYRSYAALGRPYVAWNVFAAPEFSVEPKTWCFPIAGCVAYRGYFKEAAARDYAASLSRRGYDVYVGPVPAYSTLGHFNDPLLDTMLRYDDLDLVAILFHELAHQVTYRPGETEFNEAFATVVEYEGLQRWLASRGEQAQIDTFRERRRRQVAVAQRLLAARDELAALYASEAAISGKREAKAAVFAQLRSSHVDGELNNARLAAVAAYERCVPVFESLLRREGGDLPAFYAAVRRLSPDTCTFP